jgi:2-dehydropantoate 2-reductase
MRLAILGAGGVGGFLAGALGRAGTPVTLIARGKTAPLVRRRGLKVTSTFLDAAWTARPEVVVGLDEPVDVLIVATKALGLEAALERVHADPGLVVPLLNGVDHVAALRERFPAVVAAVIRVEATRTAPGVIEQTSPLVRVDLATEGPEAPPVAPGLPVLLEGAGVPVHVGGTEAEVLWSKLVRLNAIALTTAAFGVPIGEVRADPARREALEGAVREAAAIARAEGARMIHSDAILGEIAAVHDGLLSSMARDVEAGREPELDAIAGAVLRAAARHQLPAPTVRELADRVAERAGIGAPVS